MSLSTVAINRTKFRIKNKKQKKKNTQKNKNKKTSHQYKENAVLYFALCTPLMMA